MTFGQVKLMLSTLSFIIFGTLYIPGFSLLPTLEWGSPPSSVLASKCDRLWVKEARNDLALRCFLTSQPDRLCRDEEKAHVLWFIRHYERNKEAFNRKLLGYLVGVQLRMAMPSARREDGKTEDVMQKLDRVTLEQAAKLKKDDNFLKAIRLETLPDPELSALLRKLAARGFLAKDDFGWSAPDWVLEAFEGDLKVKPGCSKSLPGPAQST